MPAIHEREALVRTAERQVRDVLLDALRPLTLGERLRVLASVFGDKLATIAKYEIREERHPDDPERPGGLAPAESEAG